MFDLDWMKTYVCEQKQTVSTPGSGSPRWCCSCCIVSWQGAGSSQRWRRPDCRTRSPSARGRSGAAPAGTQIRACRPKHGAYNDHDASVCCYCTLAGYSSMILTRSWHRCRRGLVVESALRFAWRSSTNQTSCNMWTRAAWRLIQVRRSCGSRLTSRKLGCCSVGAAMLVCFLVLCQSSPVNPAWTRTTGNKGFF